MPPSMTIEAAQEHDRLIASAFHRIVGSEAGSPAQCERALRQARLPVKLGGLGLTSMAAIRRAAWVGTWALVWTPPWVQVVYGRVRSQREGHRRF